MKSQQGFALTGYLALAGVVVFLLMFAAIKIQSSRLASAKVDLKTVKAEYKGFKDEVERIGKQALADKAAKEAKERTLKEKADAENERTVAALRATVNKLRLDRASSSFVPGASPTASRPDRATFDRAELERAIRELDKGVQGLVDEGDQGRVNLNTALKWATELRAR